MIVSLWRRFLGLSDRFPWLTTALALVSYVIGLDWRYRYIFIGHDPREFVYSDMALYVNLAKKFAKPDAVLRMNDVTHPPGATVIFSWLYRADPTMALMTWFQFVVCALVPLSVALLAWVAFSRRTAGWALAASSLYFPFIDYGGYFLSEIQMIFVIPLALAVLLLAAKQKTIAGALALALVGGIVFSWAIALKALSLLAGGFAALVFLFFQRETARSRKALILVVMALGAAPVTTWMARRCTGANDGQFCLSNNKTAADVLIGHYGRIQTITWKDPKGGSFTFGNPSDFQHGYSKKKVVEFAMTDNRANMEEAKRWMKAHPSEAVTLTLQHVYDMYATQPWPTAATKMWQIGALHQDAFILFSLFPACAWMFEQLRRVGLRRFVSLPEVFVLSPFLGLIASVMIATGEPRYRVPFDSLFIIVAIEFYRNWRAVRAAPQPAPLPDPEQAPRLSLSPTEPQPD